MALYAVAGWKLFIGAVLEPGKEDLTAADFTGETWVEVDGWETMGALGDTAQTITTALINRGRDVKQKGTRNAGAVDMQFAALLGVDGDPGQDAMIAAEATNSNFAFKIEANDAPTGGDPTTLFFAALVMSKQFQGGSANTIQMRSFNLEINSNVLEVRATA